MPGTNTPKHSRTESINRLAIKADALAALLIAFDLLPDSAQQSALETCLSMANAVVGDLSVLVGGAT